MRRAGFVPLIVIAAVATFLVAGVGFFAYQEWQHRGPIVGGDRDAHGCIGSAGYTWCAAKQACIRPWEESCATAGETPCPDVCPQLSPPAPGWCAGGVIVPSANDACSCAQLPTCVRDSGEQGVTGHVLLGPTCPVERIPPDPACAAKKYQTTIQAIREGSPASAPYATVETDADGSFRIELPPGDYALQPAGGQPFPICRTTAVTVAAGTFQDVDLSCDTGIR